MRTKSDKSTGESYIHSLMNVLRYCNLDESLQGEEGLVCQSALGWLLNTKELDCMSQLVLRMFENTEVALDDLKRFCIELTFSRGVDLSPLEVHLVEVGWNTPVVFGCPWFPIDNRGCS